MAAVPPNLPAYITVETAEKMAVMDQAEFVGFALFVWPSVGMRIGAKRLWEQLTGHYLDAGAWCKLTERPPPEEEEEEPD